MFITVTSVLTGGVSVDWADGNCVISVFFKHWTIVAGVICLGCPRILRIGCLELGSEMFQTKIPTRSHSMSVPSEVLQSGWVSVSCLPAKHNTQANVISYRRVKGGGGARIARCVIQLLQGRHKRVRFSRVFSSATFSSDWLRVKLSKKLCASRLRYDTYGGGLKLWELGGHCFFWIICTQFARRRCWATLWSDLS